MSPSQLLERFKWSLQALALPADSQLQQFPDFVIVTDELMLEFDHWRNAAAGQHAFTAEQQAALDKLDKLFDQMSEVGLRACASRGRIERKSTVGRCSTVSSLHFGGVWLDL